MGSRQTHPKATAKERQQKKRAPRAKRSTTAHSRLRVHQPDPVELLWMTLAESVFKVDELARLASERGEGAAPSAEVAMALRALAVAFRTGLEPQWLKTQAASAYSFLERNAGRAAASRKLEAPWRGVGEGGGLTWVAAVLPTTTLTPLAQRRLLPEATRYFACRWLGAAMDYDAIRRWAREAAFDFPLFLAGIAPRPLPKGSWAPREAPPPTSRRSRDRLALTRHQQRLANRLASLLDEATPVPRPTPKDYEPFLGCPDQLPERLRHPHWEHPDIWRQATKFAQAALHIFGFRANR